MMDLQVKIEEERMSIKVTTRMARVKKWNLVRTHLSSFKFNLATCLKSSGCQKFSFSRCQTKASDEFSTLPFSFLGDSINLARNNPFWLVKAENVLELREVKRDEIDNQGPGNQIRFLPLRFISKIEKIKGLKYVFLI